ncbi:MAG TPA: zf-TFIIB domain-containing protein [Ramlibacter sp.]|nr:zf-TFIIB domain-containing protein [Ramlibacter sp.]
MQCPVCKSVNLVMSERSGIEIDYCPQCRGVWLDRGELDKIIERASPSAASVAPYAQPAAPHVQPAAPYQQPAPPYQQPAPGYDPRHAPQQPAGYYKKRKREGFLGELFDFD